jgi:hypothetical protein
MLKPADRRLLKGYGPLAALVLAFVLMAAFVPTIAREQTTTEVAATGGAGSAAGADGASGAAAGATGAASGAGTSGTAGTAGTAGSAKGSLPANTGACKDRSLQVPGDPYSPPCIAFSGSNGGATSMGVSPTTITVAYRVTNDKGFQQTLAELGGASFSDTPADIKRTIQGLQDYFNKHFQFYGRKLNIVFYNGQGTQTAELLGGGQEQASADAITVGQKIKAFADLSAATEPYADALAKQKVVGFGVPYLSSQWMSDRAPYSWSIATDCTIISQTSAEFADKQLAGAPAKYAGGSLQNKPRKFAILAPDNPWYQQCVNSSIATTKAAGNPAPLNIEYQLNLSTLSSQAASIIQKLKSNNITTVFCGCDPIMPIYLTSKAAEQNYTPEWGVEGTALTDQDEVGQLFTQSEWQHAFGISYLGAQLPQRATLGYAAYSSVRSDSPAFAVDLIYSQMYMLALGIQLAGPDLTPQSYEKGMFSYKGGTGPYGTWGFGPGHFTPTQDSHEIYWDPNKQSTYNSKQGAYVVSTPRYKAGQYPSSKNVKAFGG